jgi:hypothetical protein
MAPHPLPLSASGEREGPAKREGEGHRVPRLAFVPRENPEPDSRGLVRGIRGNGRARRISWVAGTSPAMTVERILCLARSVRLLPRLLRSASKRFLRGNSDPELCSGTWLQVLSSPK